MLSVRVHKDLLISPSTDQTTPLSICFQIPDVTGVKQLHIKVKRLCFEHSMEVIQYRTGSTLAY